MVRVFGIVNVTRDSFSDGGRFLTPENAVAHAQRLLDEGADVIDIGAESTHPDSEQVSEREEIDRLTPVVSQLRRRGCALSVDTCKPAVMARMIDLGVDYINDVRGFRTPGAVEAVRDAAARLIVMHSRSSEARAQRTYVDPSAIVDEVRDFFRRRLAELTAAGVARERLILDPGMGFFLG
ncbi:MAG: dihydropteroate synthase, partial [Planctomycetota bacterium]